MGHLILQGDNIAYPGFSLLGESSLAITFDDTGTNFLALDFLVLSGTTSVSIDSTGTFGAKSSNAFTQLAETNNDLATVTISGPVSIFLGTLFSNSNAGDGVVTDIAARATSPTTIHSSLKLIDASATTGEVDIIAGGTNTSGAGHFGNGASLNANITITYTGLEIKGGSGSGLIENDAKNGIVTDGNGTGDQVILGGAGAKATLGTGSADDVSVGVSLIGTKELAGSALGDTVKFGSAATAFLVIGSGAEAGSTAGTTNIGLTKVLDAAAGMIINFRDIGLSSSNIVDETAAVASLTTFTAAENEAVKTMGSAGVAYFTFGKNEYFIATNNAETTVSSSDAIVELVGITNIHHAATISGGVVALHV